MKSFVLKRRFSQQTERFAMKRFHTSDALFWHNWLLAISAVLLCGTFSRIAMSRLTLISQSPVLLPVALNNFPHQVSDWADQNMQIPDYIKKMTVADDFLYRFFVNKSSNQWVNLYVAYSGRPGTMLGHRPEICYVAEGWIHESSQMSQFYDAAGKSIPCTIHRFHKPGNDYEDMVVLNFYVLNGRIVNAEKDFSGLGWRIPNLNGNPAHYVAQVQISSVLENTVRTAAKDMIWDILGFLPDEKGRVKAAEYIDLTEL
jgi:hypothetical protein